jgi:hypothetical protein
VLANIARTTNAMLALSMNDFAAVFKLRAAPPFNA